MFNRSVVTKTGQWWKYLLGTAALFAGVIVVLVAIYSDFHYTLFVPLVMGGLVTAMLGIFVPAATIKCPTCGMKWLWYAFRNKEHNQWFMWFVSVEDCPDCGFPKQPANQSIEKGE